MNRGNEASFTRTLAAACAICLSVLGSALLAACGSSRPTPGTTPSPVARFYRLAHPLARRSAGTLIRAEKVPLPLHPPATVWRILYHSRSASGRDIAVSGFAVVPASRAKGVRRPVYAWAHGSSGQADRCAPSRDIPDNLPPYGGQLVARNAVLVATDYQGLGTPGEPTPYVGLAEAHAILDSIRAAKQLRGVGRLGPVVIAGQSQGGGAALWAAQLAHTYAPSLDVRGVVALAPAAELTTIVRSLRKPPFSVYLGEALWAIDGLKAAYGARLDVSDLLTPAARADLSRVAKECEQQTIARWRGRSLYAVFARDPLSDRSLVEVLEKNSPGGSDPHVPIFLGQGSQDQVIPQQVVTHLETRYCRLGANVTRRVYAGADHDGVIDAASNDVLTWIANRVRRRPMRSSCTPTAAQTP
jgi:alpha-beta hydrolase superfamily lysophospholipase